MGETSMVLNLILLAVAVGVFLKLRSVLGRRTWLIANASVALGSCRKCRSIE